PRYAGRRYDRQGPELDDRTAALVIGDPALALAGRFSHVLDLGQAWFEWTGLPFVFAAWGARQRNDISLSDQEALRGALAEGLRRASTPGSNELRSAKGSREATRCGWRARPRSSTSVSRPMRCAAPSTRTTSSPTSSTATSTTPTSARRAVAFAPSIVRSATR